MNVGSITLGKIRFLILAKMRPDNKSEKDKNLWHMYIKMWNNKNKFERNSLEYAMEEKILITNF